MVCGIIVLGRKRTLRDRLGLAIAKNICDSKKITPFLFSESGFSCVNV